MDRKRPPRNGDRRRSLDLADRRRRVFEAWCKGEAQHLIADREGVNPAQITRDLDAVMKELHGRDLDKAEENRLELLGKIAHAEAELLAAWERSKLPKDRTKGKKVEGESTRREAETITEGRDGEPKFWAQLTRLWEFKAKLLGLLKPDMPLTPDGRAVQIAIVEAVAPNG